MTQIEIVGSMNPLFSLSVCLIPFRSPRYLSFPSICEYPCLPDSSSSCPTDRSLKKRPDVTHFFVGAKKKVHVLSLSEAFALLCQRTKALILFKTFRHQEDRNSRGHQIGFPSWEKSRALDQFPVMFQLNP